MKRSDFIKYEGKLCSFIRHNITYNCEIDLCDDYVYLQYMNSSNVKDFIRLTYNQFHQMICGGDNENLNFELINNVMEIKDYDGKLCSFKYNNKEYSDILVKIISNSIWFINDGCKNHIRRGIPIERFTNVVSGNDDIFTDFKLKYNIEEYVFKKWGFIRCRIALLGCSEIDAVIRVSGDIVTISTLEGMSLKNISHNDYIKHIKEPRIDIRKFYIVEDDDMSEIEIFKNFNNKICICQIDGKKRELKIFIDVIDDKISLREGGYELCLKNVETTMNFLLKNNRTYDSKITNFRLINNEDKKELTTVRDYYNKYNARLCCFNNGNGTKKYRINVSLYNDSVYLNSNLNEIKYDESLCRKIDIHTFDYLLKNGKSLNKIITDFRLLESEKKKITMKEISEKFNIHVNDIEIVK